MSGSLQSHFEISGMRHDLTTAHTPHQNGVAERLNRTLIALMRSMLQGKGLSKSLWAEALATALYVRNRVTCRGLKPSITPHNIWNGRAPILIHARVFGSKCSNVLPKVHVQKLDSRSQEATFVGYYEINKAYKLLDSSSGHVVISRGVIFNEVSHFENSSAVDEVSIDLQSGGMNMVETYSEYDNAEEETVNESVGNVIPESGQDVSDEEPSNDTS